jgi:glyoxylase-like metal-dependent hydrolase (beta-lactamase superfamily II)
MIHEILPVGALECNCSIFGDELSHEAIVIDPGDDVGRILEVLARHALKVKAIVITHAHIDHIGAAAELKRITRAPVYMNPHDAGQQAMLEKQAAWLGVPTPEKVGVDAPLNDGDTLQLGQAEFRVLYTPGHTPGGISLYIPSERKVVVGDALFAGSVGRTDLPGGDGPLLLRSIREKLLPLPDETIVIPGHGGLTTIGREKQFNFFLQE